MTMRSWVQVLETASCRNARKSCIHKTQNGWTMHKRELVHRSALLFMITHLTKKKLPSLYVSYSVVGGYKTKPKLLI
jgi:hypothetical protein